MNAMKRILAMLLTLIMVMGCAFAEGEVLMIAQGNSEEHVHEEALAEIPEEEFEMADLEGILFEEFVAEEEPAEEEEAVLEEAELEEEDDVQTVKLMQTNDSGCAHEWGTYYEWDEENGKETYTYKCVICGELNTCDHAWEIYDEDRRYIDGTDNGDGTHNGKYTVETYGECMLCGVYGWQQDDTVYTAENEAHDWGYYDSETGESMCRVCYVANPCKHDFMQIDEYRDVQEDTVKDNGDGTHSYKYYAEYAYKCAKCGCEYWQRDNEKLLTEKAEKHSWDGDECWNCGAKNTCTHKNKVENYTNEYARMQLHSSDASGHVVTAYTETWYECPDCGSYFNVVSEQPTTVNAKKPHEWWKGECEICGYANPCKHPNWTAEWSNYATEDGRGSVVSTTATSHTLIGSKYDTGDCPDCGEYVEKLVESNVQFTEAHEYDSDGECWACGYQNTCKHEKTLTSYDIYDYGDGGKKVDDNHHTVTGKLVKITRCKTCGQNIKESVSKTYTFFMPHDVTDQGKCYTCGYTKTKENCKHENTWSQEGFWWVKAEKKNEKYHVYTLEEREMVYCDDCGKLLEKNVKGNTEKQEEVHYLNFANVCMDCGYVSTCKHKNTTSKTGKAYPWYYGANESKHYVFNVTQTTVTCDDCKAVLSDLTYRKITEGDQKKHSYDGHECKYCGVHDNQCEHEMVNGVCKHCGMTCVHSYKKCVCTKCGDVNHKGIGLLDCFCEDCGQTLHDLKDDVCQRCGGKIIDVKSITVNNALNANGRLEIGFKLKEELKLNIEPADALANISFKTSNKKVATVDANGVITAKAAGKATITITVDNYNTPIDPIKVNVTVTKAPTSIALPKAAKGGELLFVGESLELKETVKPAGAIAELTWTSNKPEVATVEDGVVKGVAAGTAKITVKTQNGKKATYSVKVVPVPTGIQVEDAILLGEKQTHTLKASLLPEGAEGKITYTLSGDAITLSGNKITAKKAGNAQITVSAYGVPDKIVNVSVVKAPAKVSLDRSSVTAAKSEKTLQLKATIADDEYTKFTWTTSNKKVAIVDENGLVTLKGKGTATITVKTHNGKTAKCKVTVAAKAPTGLNLSAAEIGMLKGDTAKLTAKFKKNEGSSMLNVKVEPAGIVTYENGVLTAIGTGTATVTFETANNVSASCKVVVSAALKEIVLMDGDQPTSYVELSGKQSMQLGVKRIDEEGKEMLVGSYSFKSSKPNIVSVSKTGKVTVKNPKDIGNATITVTGYNGVKAELYVFYCPAPTKVQMLSYETYEAVKKATLTVGETLDLYVDVEPMLKEMDTPADLKISSNKKAVASVAVNAEYDRKITITAAKPGKATITVKTHNGKIAKCVVTVKAAK